MEPPCFYLLVAADTDKARVSAPCAYEVALHRLSLGKWGLRDRTPFRRSIKAGDRVLIYLAGKRMHGGKVIASARVCCAAQRMSSSLAATIDSPSESRSVLTHFYIDLEDANVFPNPMKLSEFQSRLSFVSKPNTTKWGTRLQAGCIQLTGADYEMITGNSK